MNAEDVRELIAYGEITKDLYYKIEEVVSKKYKHLTMYFNNLEIQVNYDSQSGSYACVRVELEDGLAFIRATNSSVVRIPLSDPDYVQKIIGEIESMMLHELLISSAPSFITKLTNNAMISAYHQRTKPIEECTVEVIDQLIEGTHS